MNDNFVGEDISINVIRTHKYVLKDMIMMVKMFRHSAFFVLSQNQRVLHYPLARWWLTENECHCIFMALKVEDKGQLSITRKVRRVY